MFNFESNPEAFSADFENLQELLSEAAQMDAMREAAENSTAELNQLAEDVREMDEDLAERLSLAADNNPLSEAAFDLKAEAYSLL